MKTITAVKQKNGNKYEVIIDKEKHIIYGDVLLDCGILKPCTIDTTTYVKIVNLNNYYDAYYKIINYLNYKKRTEKEVRNKLDNLLLNKKDMDSIISKLYEKKLLDDDNYLISYINDQLHLTLHGPFKIKYQLSKLGFSDEVIDKHLSNIDHKEWPKRVEKLINKKLKTQHHLSKKAFIQKLRIELNNLGYNESHYLELLNKIDISDQDNLLKEYQKYKQKLSKKYSGDKLEIMVKRKLYALGYDVNSI